MKIKINTLLINKKTNLTSFDFQPNDLNFNENKGTSTTINKLIATVTNDKSAGLNNNSIVMANGDYISTLNENIFVSLFNYHIIAL